MPRAGNILDNEGLISTLEAAKASAVKIAGQLERARATAVSIDEARSRYTPAALRGAVLFFAMASLSNVSNMYQYSLASFLTVFRGSLAGAKKDAGIIERRVANIAETATLDAYNYTCLGLFECHKLAYSFQVRRSILHAL
jgi:dynein heavy chain, axonemal